MTYYEDKIGFNFLKIDNVRSGFKIQIISKYSRRKKWKTNFTTPIGQCRFVVKQVFFSLLTYLKHCLDGDDDDNYY